jgi:hypothetical protein
MVGNPSRPKGGLRSPLDVRHNLARRPDEVLNNFGVPAGVPFCRQILEMFAPRGDETREDVAARVGQRIRRLSSGDETTLPKLIDSGARTVDRDVVLARQLERIARPITFDANEQPGGKRADRFTGALDDSSNVGALDVAIGKP